MCDIIDKKGVFMSGGMGWIQSLISAERKSFRVKVMKVLKTIEITSLQNQKIIVKFEDLKIMRMQVVQYLNLLKWHCPVAATLD